jgi:hypothetical protein
MCEPHRPEPPTLEAAPQRHTAWARGVPIVLTVAIFWLIFWRIPFGAFWHALARAQLLPFLALIGSFAVGFLCSIPLCWPAHPMVHGPLLP